jgi:DNA invertase Pin-like site-specific DNA recombinase
VKRVLALIRVSTDAQDVSRQRADIKKLAERYGLDIIRVLELIGVSGTATLSNEQVQQVLREAQQPGVEGLAASAVDRLFRPKRGGDFSIINGFQDARRALWTVRDGHIEPWTDEGWERFMAAGTRAGAEWREIRRRSMDGKAAKRAEGRHVNGNQSLPPALRFDKRTGWSYDETELAKVKHAYTLLFEDRHSLSEIARRAGYVAATCVRRTLANPTFKGLRVYPPAGERIEPLEIALPLKPLLTPEKWALAQTLLAKRRTWTRGTCNPRHLGAGLLVCRCGRRFYNRCDTRRGQHDTYYCASRHPRGKGCGEPHLWRETVDAAIVRIVEEHMTDAKFRSKVFQRIKQTPAPDTRGERERELAKLAARRQRWMDAYDEERITKLEFGERMDKINVAMRTIEATMPAAPPPPLDTRAVIGGLVEEFAAFRTWPFLEQRATLKRVVRSLLVADSSFTEVAVSGAYVGELAYTKPAQPLKSRCSRKWPARARKAPRR